MCVWHKQLTLVWPRRRFLAGPGSSVPALVNEATMATAAVVAAGTATGVGTEEEKEKEKGTGTGTETEIETETATGIGTGTETGTWIGTKLERGSVVRLR